MTSGVLVDALARSRITGELGANLCVEAAAGTGKTTVLVRRVASLLAAGVVTVDQLVVITFTEKAAAELSTRVRDELERRANEVDDEEQRRRLLDAARDLYRAHIETIHSFATALLRERPVEAGIDPLFEVLEGLAAGLDFDEAYERFQDELLASDDPDLERALRREFGLQELREACEHLHAHRYLLPLAYPGSSGGRSCLHAPPDASSAWRRRTSAGLRPANVSNRVQDASHQLRMEGCVGVLSAPSPNICSRVAWRARH